MIQTIHVGDIYKILKNREQEGANFYSLSYLLRNDMQSPG